MCIADADMLSAEIPDGNCLGEKDDPPQHRPTSMIFHKGSSPTAISKLRDQREEHGTPPIVEDVENSSQVIVNRQDNRILLANIRALKERCNMMLEEVPEMWVRVPETKARLHG